MANLNRLPFPWTFGWLTFQERDKLNLLSRVGSRANGNITGGFFSQNVFLYYFVFNSVRIVQNLQNVVPVVPLC